MLIELQNIYKIYNAGKGDKEVRALDGVSLSIEKGVSNCHCGPLRFGKIHFDEHTGLSGHS